MLVFKLQGRDGHSEKIFTGFHVDKNLEVLITLASIGEGISKSELFRRAVDSFFEDMDVGNPKTALIKKVATRAVEIFKYKNDYETTITVDNFREYLELDLEKKKVPSDIITSILEKFDAKVDKIK